MVTDEIQQISRADSIISHYPRLGHDDNPDGIDPKGCEELLTEWFGNQVILLASGRSGLNLYLNAKGFRPYQHTLQIPPYLSRCFMSSMTFNTFPVLSPIHGDCTFLYHQYGFTQRWRPSGVPIVEDIAHSFFTSHDTGTREWKGEVAVFSLPKFFAIGGLAGGLVIRNPALADKIREMVSASPLASPELRSWMQNVIGNAYRENATNSELTFVESAYELLYEFVHPWEMDLAGFPASIEGICQVGEQRLEIVRFYRSFFASDATPIGFWDESEELLPFGIPYFGNGNTKRLQRASEALREQGVLTSIYHVDVNRDMSQPNYQACLLLPCHQNISIDTFEEICRTVHANA